jgi:hypothetical protein
VRNWDFSRSDRRLIPWGDLGRIALARVLMKRTMPILTRLRQTLIGALQRIRWIGARISEPEIHIQLGTLAHRRGHPETEQLELNNAWAADWPARCARRFSARPLGDWSVDQTTRRECPTFSRPAKPPEEARLGVRQFPWEDPQRVKYKREEAIAAAPDRRPILLQRDSPNLAHQRSRS